MLNIKKYLCVCVVNVTLLCSGLSAQAEIVGTLEFGNNFYLLETVDTQATVYEYDMAAATTSVSSLFQFTGEPTAMAYDGTNFYMTVGSQLFAYDRSGTRSFIRNLFTDAITMFSAGDRLIILLGAPDNVIITVNKDTSSIDSSTPRVDALGDPIDPDEDLFPIHDIYYDVDGDRIIAQIANAGDNNQNSNQYMSATFNNATGELGTLTGMDFVAEVEIPPDGPAGNIALEAPTGLGEPFFLDDLEMAMDSEGNVVDFSGDAVVFSHGNRNSVDALAHFINPSFNNSTDNIIDFASDDDTYAYFTMTLDNECNTDAPVGGSRVARWRKTLLGDTGFYLFEEWNGYLVNRTHYYDTANSVHTMANLDGNIFLFYGEGEELAVEVITDGDFSYPFFPWSNDSYNPASADMSKVRQSTSFTLEDGVGNPTDTIAMQIEQGCDHYVAFWDTGSNSFTGYTETFWYDAIDGAYVPGLDRIFLAFTDGTNYWITHLSASNPESDNPINFAPSAGFATSEIHQLIAAGNYLVVNMTNDDGDRIRSYELSDDSLDIGDLGVQNLSLVSATTNDDIEDCCSAWSSAIYSSINGQIYYVNNEGLFAIEFDEDNGTFSGPDDGNALKSSNYIFLQEATGATPAMALNEDETLLFVDGQIYRTSDLGYQDSFPGPVFPDVAIFKDNTITVYDSEGTEVQTWALNVGDDDLISRVPTSTVELNGSSISALLPILSGADVVTLILDQKGDGTMGITLDGNTEESELIGSSDGSVPDEEPTDDDADSDSGSSGSSGCGKSPVCVPTPGSGSGGPLDGLVLGALLALLVRLNFQRQIN